MNGRTILVVDDHPDNREVYALVLEHSGYEVLTAGDGRQAVETARAHLPDLVLMDISMPVLDGLQATEILKSDPVTHGIPVLVITAHDDPRMLRRSVAAGVAGYLLKPAAPAVVLAEIERCLGSAASRTAPTAPRAASSNGASGRSPEERPSAAN